MLARRGRVATRNWQVAAPHVAKAAYTATNDTKRACDGGVVRGGGAHKGIGLGEEEQILQGRHAERSLQRR